MDANGFQQWSATTDIGAKTDWYYALGLAGEVGEVVEKIKKAYRIPPLPVDPKAMGSELSDVLWYLARLASFYGFSLTQIMAMNVEKLESRRNRGVLQGTGDNR